MIKPWQILGFVLLIEFSLKPVEVSINTKQIDDSSQNITITFKLVPHEVLYKNSLDFSVDNPAIQLSPWHSTKEATNRYDTITKESKHVFAHDISITMVATKTNSSINTHDANLHVMYHVNTQPSIFHHIFPLVFNEKDLRPVQSVESKIINPSPEILPVAPQSSLAQTPLRFTKHLSTLVEKTQSTSLRMVLVFLLGILLSLTPCIYPMIPITAGVLQTQRGSSVIYNFFLSCAYTLGIATTFACFGLLASSSGSLYGKLLVHPVSVIILILILSYLAFSMFGLYEIYIPRFLQPKTSTKTNGSLVSAFIFGAMSGTIASPCVSPGLALLLSIVASLGNAILGFFLLFSFGVGLSMPLLLIGTFSSSLTLLPRAGMWMMEIKKIFGLMLFGACFYYLSNIVPWYILIWFIALFTALLGTYYLYCAQYTTNSPFWKKSNNIIGTIILSGSVIIFAHSYQITYLQTHNHQQHDFWLTDYNQAKAQASASHKKLFIDFWAQYCSICKAINNGLFTQPEVISSLQNFVSIKVDGTFENKEPFKTLKTNYPISGFPVFLIVDPTTNQVIKQWGSELYYMTGDAFSAELNSYV